VAAGFTRTTVGVVRAAICQPCQSRPIADVIKFLGEHASPPLLMANVEIN
jgi:hypothetical protein